MMEQLKEERIRIEAQQARQILENPLFQRHGERMRVDLVRQMLDEDDRDRRDELWRKHRMLEEYLEDLRQYIYTAKTLGEEEHE